MNLIIGLTLITLPFGGPERQGGAPRDPWFGADKVKHFVVSAVIQSAGYSVLRANGYEYRDAAWTAGAMTLTVGVSKEMWDARQGRIFSWKDLVADAAGGATGAVVMKQTNP